MKTSKILLKSVRIMRFFPNPYNDFNPNDCNLDQASRQVYLAKARQVANLINTNMKAVESNIDGGLYVGPAGVAYSLWKMSSFVSDAQERQVLLQQAHRLVNLNLMYVQRPDMQRDKQNRVGFLLGATGVQAVAAVIANSVGNQQEMQSHLQSFSQVVKDQLLLPKVVHRCGSDELFVGRAGYLAGALWLNKMFQASVIQNQDLFAICDAIVQSGLEYSHRRSGQSRQKLPPLMYSYYDTEYLGAAHGLCAILQMLLSVPGYVDQCQYKNEIIQSVDFFLAMQSPSGNFPCAMDEAPPYRSRPDSEELVHWCHGAPGVVYMLAKAWLVLKDDKYLTGALRCGECVWNKGLLKKGPGICHGVAGSGYVFLLLYRLTKDPRHLYRAMRFADFLETDTFKAGARQPDCPLSLYEGWAGTLCYLLDLVQPDQSHFPFSDIF